MKFFYSFLLFIVMAAILEKVQDCWTKVLLATIKEPSTPNLVQMGLVVSSEKIFKEFGYIYV